MTHLSEVQPSLHTLHSNFQDLLLSVSRASKTSCLVLHSTSLTNPRW